MAVRTFPRVTVASACWFGRAAVPGAASCGRKQGHRLLGPLVTAVILTANSTDHSAVSLLTNLVTSSGWSQLVRRWFVSVLAGTGLLEQLAFLGRSALVSPEQALGDGSWGVRSCATRDTVIPRPS